MTGLRHGHTLHRGDRLILAHLFTGARMTVRDAGRIGGWSSTSTTLQHLQRLRRLELITWDTGKAGTIRATVAPVRFGAVA